MAQRVKNPPSMQETEETWVRSLGWEDPLEEEIAACCIILAWKNPTDRGAWWAAVHGITKSDTTERLSAHTRTQHDACGKAEWVPPPYLLSKLSWGSWERPSFTPEWGPPSFLLSQGPTHITSSPGRCWRSLCLACSFPGGSLGPRSLHCPELMACVLCLPPPPGRPPGDPESAQPPCLAELPMQFM